MRSMFMGRLLQSDDDAVQNVSIPVALGQWFLNGGTASTGEREPLRALQH